jgi:hypothetical protein
MMRLVRICLVVLFGAVIVAPMTAQVAGFNPGPQLEENRALAGPVPLPRQWTDVLRIPAQADDYFRDHFGMRGLSLRVHDELVWHILHDSPSVQVTRGREGMLFFNSHGADHPDSLIALSCGIDITPAELEPTTRDIADFLQQARRINVASTLVVIPTKGPVYPELLPAWLAERCQKAEPPTSVIERQIGIRPQLAAMMQYPLDEMKSLKASMPVYPLQAFHWTGALPRLIAEQIAERTFGLSKERNLNAHAVVEHSDIQRFVPGINLWMEDLVPEYAASGVRDCVGPSCFPEFAGIAARLVDVRRFVANGRPGKKLLLISDSFGAGIAGWFSQYFSQVWHINVNNLINNPEPDSDQDQFSKTIFSDYAPDYIVYLFHDGSVLYAPHQLLGHLSMSGVPATTVQH